MGQTTGARRRLRRSSGAALAIATVVVAAAAVRVERSGAQAASGAPRPAGTAETFGSEPDKTWGTSPSDDPADAGRDKAGRVVTLAEVGTKIFVGGEFTGLTPPGVSTTSARNDSSQVVHRPYLAAFDVTTGALLDWDAHPDAPVLSLAVSGDGHKLYVGGMFKTIGGKRASRLAAVDVDTGVADGTFTPPIPDAYVKAMALSGDRLYIGGAFAHLGDVARAQLAAVEADTGKVVPDWVPPPTRGGHFEGHTGNPVKDQNPGNVADLKVTPAGDMVVVGGSFLDFAGHSGLIVLDAQTAQPTPWQPVLDRPRPVYGLDVWPTDGRTIFTAAGGWGGTVEAFTAGGSPKPKWVHRTDGDGTDVAATDQRVYFVGHYDFVLGNNTQCGSGPCTGGNPGDTPNRHIAAFDPQTGAQDTTFTAQFNTPQGPEVALIGAHHLYVGGNFTKVNFLAHPGFAQFPEQGES